MTTNPDRCRCRTSRSAVIRPHGEVGIVDTPLALIAERERQSFGDLVGRGGEEFGPSGP